MKAGKKFYDSELIAAHKRIIINSNTKETKQAELLILNTGEKSMFSI
jgi:hypothetical protein